jgi:hypothetical protein
VGEVNHTTECVTDLFSFVNNYCLVNLYVYAVLESNVA